MELNLDGVGRASLRQYVTGPKGDRGDQGPEGPRGPEGPEGPQGLPGVNAVANDTATATYIADDGSATRAALDAAVAEDVATTTSDTRSALRGALVEWVDYGTNPLTPRPSATAGVVIWRGDAGAPLPANAQPQDVVMIDADVTPPTAVTNLTAVLSGTDVVLAWTASTDNLAVTGYKVYRAAASGFTPSSGNLLTTVTSGTTYTDTSPLTGLAYYKVTAIDAEGNESTAVEVAPFNPFGLGITWHTALWAEKDSAADGATLATLTDQSGNARHLTTAGSPLFEHTATGLGNKKAYVFDGVDDSATTTSAFTALTLPYTMVMVAYRPRTGSGAKAAMGGVTSAPANAGAVQWSVSNYIYTFNAGVDLTPNRTDDLVIIIVDGNGATSTLEINGYSASGSAGVAAQPVKWILGNRQGSSWFARLDVAFVGFVAGTLTADQKRALRDGAESFYGLTINPAA